MNSPCDDSRYAVGQESAVSHRAVFADQDVELLLGKDVPLSKMRDHTFGRVLDRLAEVGTNMVLGIVVMGVIKSFDLEMSHVDHDTTSNTLYGDYAFYDEENPVDPFLITCGQAHCLTFIVTD